MNASASAESWPRRDAGCTTSTYRYALVAPLYSPIDNITSTELAAMRAGTSKRMLAAARSSGGLSDADLFLLPTLTTGHKVGHHRIQGISDEFIPAVVKLAARARPARVVVGSVRQVRARGARTSSVTPRALAAGSCPPALKLDVVEALHGVEDPESVEFNGISGTLFVLSNYASGPVIIETTTSTATARIAPASSALRVETKSASPA